LLAAAAAHSTLSLYAAKQAARLSIPYWHWLTLNMPGSVSEDALPCSGTIGSRETKGPFLALDAAAQPLAVAADRTVCQDLTNRPPETTIEPVVNDTVTAAVCLRKSASAHRLENLRESVGEFGVALFAPLLDWADGDDEQDDFHTLNAASADAAALTTREKVRHVDDDDMALPTGSIDLLPSDESSRRGETASENDDRCQGSDCDSNLRSDDDGSSSPPCSALCVGWESSQNLDDCPHILSLAQIQTLRQYLPESLRERRWDRCFCIGVHGDSFCTLLQKCAPFQYSIVVVQTVTGQVLGGFATATWRIRDENGPGGRHAYYGSGQSFVFASHPAAQPQRRATTHGTTTVDPVLTVYPWTGDNDYCQICDVERRVMCMGGVGDFGWIVSDDFTIGQTGPCATFGNPILCSAPSFEIADFEIYGLVSLPFFV
jgi:TLD